MAAKRGGCRPKARALPNAVPRPERQSAWRDRGHIEEEGIVVMGAISGWWNLLDAQIRTCR